MIQRGADMLGWSLDELLTRTLDAMRVVEPARGLNTPGKPEKVKKGPGMPSPAHVFSAAHVAR